MAKSDNSVEAAVAEAPAAAKTAFPLTLSEFCVRISSTDKRVELIGAFEHVERIAGRNSDLETNYASRYLAFANQPA